MTTLYEPLRVFFATIMLQKISVKKLIQQNIQKVASGNKKPLLAT
jgi:hypothetical protein